MKKTALLILDGWGIGKKDHTDAVFQANTPTMDALLQSYPNTTLTTFGEAVGLPEGQMGNSEVGHLNIGAGRIVYQELTRINKSIREGEFFQLNALQEIRKHLQHAGGALHLMGLVSEGGVHSSQAHLHALIDWALSTDIQNIFLHVFTDGRDCDPKSGEGFLRILLDKISGTRVEIATISGRYYAMDRDNRWERIAKTYHALVHGQGEQFEDALSAIQYFYNEGITDEFIPPSILKTRSSRPSLILPKDTVLCFNFRTDRPREITQALTQKAFPEYNMAPLPIQYYTMTRYDESYRNIGVLFEKDNLTETLGEVIANAEKTQVRIAETEKYPHVTFFFNGGRETPFERETRILVNSPKVATYDLQPEMSALEVTDRIVNHLKEQVPDFVCLNFANPDMVGHTGVFSAIVKAVETVDSCLGKVVDTALNLNYEIMIIADHGNADLAINEDGSPHTAHSVNPVPCILVTKEKVKLRPGILADVAPTLLARMGIQQPSAMTGQSLVSP